MVSVSLFMLGDNILVNIFKAKMVIVDNGIWDIV